MTEKSSDGFRPAAEPIALGETVLALAVSPDGRTLAAGGADHTARLLDAATGRRLTEPLWTGHPVRTVAFSGDGLLLATGCGTQDRSGAVQLWSAASGYSRYGIFIELTSGAILVWFTVYLWKRFGHLRSPLRWLPSIGVSCLLLAQAAMALEYSAHHEWSTRPTLLTRPETLRDAKLVLRDRNIISGLSDDERAPIANVDVWVTSNVKTTAFMGLLRPDIPVINALQWEYVSTRTARTAFNAVTNASANRRLYSLCFPDDLAHAREALESRGLTISSVQPISVPFFSPSNRIALKLLRISRDTPIYRAQISLKETPTRFAPSEKKTLTLRIKNTGTMLWRAYVSADGRLQVNASDTWLAEDGETVVNDMDARTALPHDLKSGEEVELQLNVTAPRTPGNYILEIDMVHEGVAFFYEKNSEPLRLNVRVGP